MRISIKNPAFLGSLVSVFNPLTVTGCKLWLKSDAGITKDGGNLVSQWNDQSGQGNHLIQGTGTNQPLWVNSAYSSKPTIRFDGIDNYIGLAVFTGGAISQPNTIFIVCTMPSATLRTVFDGTSSGGSTRHVFQRDGTTFQLFAGAAPTFGTVNTAFAQFNVLFNTTASEVRRNKSSLSSGLNVGTETLDGFRLGANITPGQYADIDVSELLIYNADVSDADRDSIENYLQTRWGL